MSQTRTKRKKGISCKNGENIDYIETKINDDV